VRKKKRMAEQEHRQRVIQRLQQRYASLQAKRLRTDEQLRVVAAKLAALHAPIPKRTPGHGRQWPVSMGVKRDAAGQLFKRLLDRPRHRFTASELVADARGFKVRELVKLWNSSHPSKRIVSDGDNKGRRYWVP
jgi:hypothetical protein